MEGEIYRVFPRQAEGNSLSGNDRHFCRRFSTKRRGYLYCSMKIPRQLQAELFSTLKTEPPIADDCAVHNVRYDSTIIPVSDTRQFLAEHPVGHMGHMSIGQHTGNGRRIFPPGPEAVHRSGRSL